MDETANRDEEVIYQPNRNLTLPISKFSTDRLKKQGFCGLGICHPPYLQKFSTAKWFLAAIGVFVLIQSMLVSGITSSVITTIEKRYGLRSAESGLVVSAFDIGSLIVVVFISYFGGRSHRARWVACGAIGVAIGAVLFTLPQFLSSPYQLPHVVSESSPEVLCNANRTNSTIVSCKTQESNSGYLGLFVLSNAIIGIGSTPIYTLGSTFIYDNVPRDDASMYMSILYAIGAVGPAAGYLLGGFFLTFYIDLDSLVPSDDPRFLGAWWLGYIVCASLILFISIFLFMFPRKLRTSKSNIETPLDSVPVTPSSTETDITLDSLDASVISFGANLRELPKALISILCNPIFVCVTFAATLEFSIVTAFLTFVPKYLQNQFEADTVTSSIITGAVLVPSAGTGILIGGYIVKRFRLNLTGCAKTALVCNVISLLLFFPVLFTTCEKGKILGINYFTDPITTGLMGNYSSLCNSECSCAGTPYNPICYEDQMITYFNPCYAGCTLSLGGSNETRVVYGNCSCLSTSSNNTVELVQRECERDCGSIIALFLFGLFLVTMATVCAHTPSLMVTYRCVTNDERPFAAGIQFMFFRALAYIPAPIYFGSAIDRACLLWQGVDDHCTDNSGSCLVYDHDKFRYIFFGIAVCCKVLATFSLFLAWLFCRRAYSEPSQNPRWRRFSRKKQQDHVYPIKYRSQALANQSFVLLVSTCDLWQSLVIGNVVGVLMVSHILFSILTLISPARDPDPYSIIDLTNYILPSSSSGAWRFLIPDRIGFLATCGAVSSSFYRVSYALHIAHACFVSFVGLCIFPCFYADITFLILLPVHLAFDRLLAVVIKSYNDSIV